MMASSINTVDQRTVLKRLKQFHPTLGLYRFLVLLLLLMLLFSFPPSSASAVDTVPQDLDREAIHALKTLFQTSQQASEMSQDALAILIFPSMTKDDATPGGSRGEGIMMKRGAVVDYYQSSAGNWDVALDSSSYSYVVFLMTEVATSYAAGPATWDKGAGPAIIMVQERGSDNFVGPPEQADAYAFVFGAEGLISRTSFKGTKITRIKR